MADPVLDIESSEQDNAPRELVTISHGGGVTVHRLTFVDHDVAHESQVYKATPGGRSEIGVSQVGSDRECTITLPINHAFVRRYLAGGVPPGKITLTIRRKYYPSDDIETIFTGEIESMSVDDDNTEATFRCESRLGRAQLRVIPNVTCGRDCPHMLYDTMCAISRTGTNPDGHAYKLTTTVLHVAGRDVRVDLTNVPAAYVHRATWCINGELFHVASGERMIIADQADLNPGVSTVTLLTMQSAIHGLKIGDSVEVYAGCLFDYDTCDQKFDNARRFGGFPYLPNKNPFVPVSYGIGDST